MTGRDRPNLATGLVVLLAVLVLNGAGCSMGDSDVRTVSTRANAPAVDEPNPSTVSEPQPGTEPASIEEIGSEIVYAGLEITFNEVAYTPDPAAPDGGRVEVTMTVTNTTKGPAEIPPMTLQAGGEEIVGSLLDFALGASETKDTSVDFTSVGGPWSPTDTVLIVGAAGDNRAEVPVDGSDPTFVQPTEPETLDATGSVPDGFAVDLKSVSLRGDFGSEPKQAPRGKVVVALELEASTPLPSGFSLSGDSFRLEPPDGPQVSPEAAAFGDDEECCVVLENAAPLAGALYFAVPEPGPGEYVLELNSGVTIADVTFAIAG